jgi:PKD repeat protein
MGYIGCAIRPKADLPTGTVIKNVALIQFDFGEIIATNQVDPHDPAQGTDPAKECLNTIDAGIPTSSVAPLPAETNTTQFVVSWCGQDDVGGSGIASYDIFLSDNGAAYTLWKDHIADTSATFQGVNGHTYAFYSIAEDNVGHEESAPTIPDAQTTVGAENQPPTVAAGVEAIIEEGAAFTRSGSFSDPDVDDNWTATVDYGDGTDPGPLALDGKSFVLDHVYADNGTYVVAVTVTDSYGQSGIGQFTLPVLNVAPIVNAGPAQAVDEGSVVSFAGSFVDPGTADTHTIEWDFGDGSTITGTLSPSHVYADDDTYTVTLRVTDDDVGVGTSTLTVSVANVAPVIALGGVGSIAEGSVYTLTLGAVTDPGDDTVSSYIVHWGDGTTEAYGSSGDIIHVYLDGPASHRVTVDLADEDGTHPAAGSLAVDVTNVAPAVAVEFPSITVDEGQTAVNAGTFSDPGQDTVTLTASVGVIIDNGNGTWGWSYATTDGPDESQTVTIVATDSDGAVTAVDFQLTVNNVAPSLSDAWLGIEENSAIGTPVGIVSGNDPGDDTLTYSIVGGNGASAFAIDANSGWITVADENWLDYETTPSFVLQVQVEDGDGGTGTATVSIDLLNQASIKGAVFVDVNRNGLYDANEPGLDGITIELLDENGVPILDTSNNPITATTSDGGFYLLEDLNPGTYQVHEVQPTGVDDGAEILGSLGGTVAANDTMQLTLGRIDAADYDFAELGQSLARGDTATIGFWQNKHGQALITQSGTALAAWLTDNFGDIFGDVFAGADGETVAGFYRDQLFRQKAAKSAGPAKVDAQFMALALSTYFTSSSLAGYIGANYGFHVTDTGIGTKIVNVGYSGAAFDVADGTDLTIMQLLLATNRLTDQPDRTSGAARIYDLNGNGDIEESEAALRRLANEVYSALNEQGGI